MKHSPQLDRYAAHLKQGKEGAYMLNELSCWKWDWNIVSSIATATGTLVALGVAVIPSWRARRRARNLARALFGYDVASVMITTRQLSGRNAVKNFESNEWPSERQKRSLAMTQVRAHMGTLGFNSHMANELASLLNQCDQLNWRIENLKDPEIDYDQGTSKDPERNRAVNRIMVTTEAERVHQTSSLIHTKLHKAPFWKRCLWRLSIYP